MLSWDGEKRVAELPSEPTADLPAIVKLAKTLFVDLADSDPDDIRVQTFDKDFQEWVDLAPSFVAKSMEKYQVVLRKVKVKIMIKRMILHSS